MGLYSDPCDAGHHGSEYRPMPPMRSHMFCHAPGSYFWIDSIYKENAMDTSLILRRTAVTLTLALTILVLTGAGCPMPDGGGAGDTDGGSSGEGSTSGGTSGNGLNAD